METKSHAELAALEWEHDVRLLQSQITLLRPGDPYRQILQNDLNRRFTERYGDRPVVTGGGATFDFKRGTMAQVIHKGDQSGYKVVPIPEDDK